MRTVSLRLADLLKTQINIGYAGENLHTRVLIDSKKIFEEYPDATPGLTVSPPKGDSYPAVITREDDVIVWDIHDSDLIYPGSGEIQLTFSVGNVVVKSFIGEIRILRSITPTGEIPEPLDDFLARASEALTAIPQTVDDAIEEAKESGQFDGPPGPPGEDGFSPSASVSKDGHVATITITDKNGTTTATVTDGDGAGAEIDDTAGAGDTDKVWSADKAVSEFGGKLDKPATAGTSGQVLTSDGQGGQVWASTASGAVVIDNTLSIPGAAAEASATGSAVSALLNDITRTLSSDAEDIDIDFTDTDGNVILRLADGHLKTKEFDSESVLAKLETVGATRWTGKKWTAMGDSLTEVNQRTTLHYHDYIAQKTGITVVNMGSSGTGFKKVEDSGRAYYQRILNVPTDSDVVTIMGSGNDLSLTLGDITDTGTSTICGCINQTIENLYSIMPVVQLGIITPAPWINNTPSDNGTMTAYADAIIAICKKRGIPCLDLFRCSNLRPSDATFRTLAYSKDDGNGVHPDETGHLLMAPHIQSFIESLLLH